MNRSRLISEEGPLRRSLFLTGTLPWKRFYDDFEKARPRRRSVLAICRCPLLELNKMFAIAVRRHDLPSIE